MEDYYRIDYHIHDWSQQRCYQRVLVRSKQYFQQVQLRNQHFHHKVHSTDLMMRYYKDN